MKMNCWEYKKCGRQPGGERVHDMGVCPVATHEQLNGVHGGSSAGRACWVVAGSLCGGRVQGAYAQKLNNCWKCDFMNIVKKEEGASRIGFSHTMLGMQKASQKQRSGAPLSNTNESSETGR